MTMANDPLKIHSFFLGVAGRTGLEGESGINQVKSALKLAKRHLELSDPNSPRRAKLEAAGVPLGNLLPREEIEREIAMLEDAYVTLTGSPRAAPPLSTSGSASGSGGKSPGSSGDFRVWREDLIDSISSGEGSSAYRGKLQNRLDELMGLSRQQQASKNLSEGLVANIWAKANELRYLDMVESAQDMTDIERAMEFDTVSKLLHNHGYGRNQLDEIAPHIGSAADKARRFIDEGVIETPRTVFGRISSSGDGGAKPPPPRVPGATSAPGPGPDRGTLADHINKVFRGGPEDQGDIWQRLSDMEFDANKNLQATGQSPGDRFQIPMSDLPRKIRRTLMEERSEALGLDRLFGPALEDSPFFTVRKAPTVTESGYGSLMLPREEFIRGQGAKSVEDVANKLAYVGQTVQMNLSGTGVIDYALSGSTPTKAFIDDSARQIFNAQDLLEGTRVVFDIESAGFDLDKKMWQLSARMMQGDAPVIDAVTGKERTINLLFRNNMMDLGLYGVDEAGAPQTMEQFYQGLRGGDITWIDSDNFPDEMRRFLDMANEADHLVGQNTAFDVRHILHGIRGKEKSSPEFEEAVKAFIKQIDDGKVVDARMLSVGVFGEGNALHIADELSDLGKYTPHSMENILLQSSFLEDLAADLGEGGWEDIRARIKTGMHHGDIDTWFEDHLVRMQAEVLSGKRTDILRSASLADRELRNEISEAGSITPFTRIRGLGNEGIDMTPEELALRAEGKDLKLTPIEFLARHERKWGLSVGDEATSAQLREGGVFSKWADDLITKEGTLRKSGRLIDSGFDAVQARAIEQGLPFAGISSFERLIATVMGRHASAIAPDGMNAARSLMGDLTGAAAIQRTKKAAIHSHKNVALPMELIMAAEQSTDIATHQRVLSSNFSGALGDTVEELQTVRWSPFTWNDGQRDVAAVADVISGQDDVDRLIRFMRGLGDDELERLGITPAQISEYADVLSEHGQRVGIQVGIMGGKDNESVATVANLLDQLGYDVDSKTHLRSSVFGLDEFKDFIFAGPGMVDSGDVFTERAEEMLSHTRLSQDMTARALDENLDPNITRAVTYGKGDPGRANRIYSFLEKNMPKMPRRLGYAGAAIAGYYLLGKAKERQEVGQTMAPQEYEQHDFYERYRAEMGQEVPQGYRTRPSERALATAGLVGNLDREKMAHHRMGPGKHDHLFGG